jgi:hypothetical protein
MTALTVARSSHLGHLGEFISNREYYGNADFIRRSKRRFKDAKDALTTSVKNLVS